MGSEGKQYRRVDLYHGISQLESVTEHEPPMEFICKISGSLMAEPTLVTSGQTFERVSIQVCQDLKYFPNLLDGTRPDFSKLISNMDMRLAILNWCMDNGVEYPTPPDYESVEIVVRAAMAEGSGKKKIVKVTSEELLRDMPEKLQVKLFLHTESDKDMRPNYFYSNSSDQSENPSIPLPFATRPECYDPSSSPSDIVPDEARSSSSSSQNPSNWSEKEYVSMMKSTEAFEQRQCVVSLRDLTKTNEETRVSLCTNDLLAALQPLLLSIIPEIQINALATLVNLSLEKVNKVKIGRSGIVQPLITVLQKGLIEAQEHAAGTLFSLALDDDNKTAIGVFGGLKPLVNALKSKSYRTQHDSAMALYNLSLNQTNRAKLVKLGAVSTLLHLLNNKTLASRVILVLCNLAACSEGKSAMLDANAVVCLVEMLRNGVENHTEATRENAVAALYSLSHGGLRFKVMAMSAGAVEVLMIVEERGSERARVKARKLLQVMRERNVREDEEDDEFHWEGGMRRNRRRPGRREGTNLNTVNSTEF